MAERQRLIAYNQAVQIDKARRYTRIIANLSRELDCYIPETPRKLSSTYVPYIFDENEWNRIIMEADKLADSLKQPGERIICSRKRLTSVLLTRIPLNHFLHGWKKCGDAVSIRGTKVL